MTWRAARSLLVLHQQLQAGAPRARPPATGADEWGLVGDAQHDPTSDHTPHDLPGLGNDIVTAADFPNRPDLGLDAHAVLDDIRRSRDPRAKYGISNGQIFSNHPVSEHGHSYAAWEWRPYLTSSGAHPADGHYTHGHLSVVGDARADGTQPWQTIGGGAMGDFDPYGKPGGNPREVGVYAADLWGQEMLGTSPYGANSPSARTQLLGRIEAKLDATLKALGIAQADIDELQARPVAAVDLPALAAALAPLLDDQLDASAVLAVLESPEGQAALVRAGNAAEDG